MTLGSVVKVVGSCEKGQENAESVMKSPTGQNNYRQDVMSIPTRCRVGMFFAWPVVEVLRQALNP